jgi:DNA-binding NtrC family response regulator
LYFPGQSRGVQPGEALDGKIVQGQGQMVLLVDDETALTSVFQVLLKLLNYKASIHNSAREALSAFAASPEAFDLVVTDLTMPEINGLEVARQVRACRPDLPVILLTGLSSTLTRENLLETGVCELLEKPVQMAALADALQRALKNSKRR